MLITIIFILLSYYLVVFGLDVFLPRIIARLKEKIGVLEENIDWRYLSMYLGWIERGLIYTFILFIREQTVVFIGIWLVLKAVGTFNTWEPSHTLKQNESAIPTVRRDLWIYNEEIRYEHHKRRAVHIIFTIGTGISLLWTIAIGLMVETFL